MERKKKLKRGWMLRSHMPFFSYIILLSPNLIYVRKEEELHGKKTYRLFATRVSQLNIWHF